MKIKLREVTIRELIKDYQDDGDGGVIGYGRKLDIRPPYQREFIYQDKQRDAVIRTIQNQFPINVMYWAARADGTFEVIDGHSSAPSRLANMWSEIFPLTTGFLRISPMIDKHRYWTTS